MVLRGWEHSQRPVLKEVPGYYGPQSLFLAVSLEIQLNLALNFLFFSRS